MIGTIIRIAVGVDYRELVAYHTAASSIIQRSSQPVAFIPIAINTLSSIFHREIPPSASTEFSFTRFLAPYLCGYEGWVIFMDSDVVVLDDITTLWDRRDDRYAIMCVKHDHRPVGDTKFLGQQQTVYEKKNWSSVMLMNCARCRALTPDYVNSASGLDLHRFNWLESEELVGEIPSEWNHLVGWSKGALGDQKLLHWTEGGPYFKAYANTKWASVWHAEHAAATIVIEKKLQDSHGR
jgi:hypothetical protein